MKLRNLILAVMAGAALLVGCNKEVDLGPAKLVVNPTDVAFTQSSLASQDITLTATRDWVVTGLPEWVALSMESGVGDPGNQTLTLSVTENKGNNRSATLTFSIGFSRAVLNVSQVGPDGEVDNGDGTKAKPFNVAGVVAYVQDLGNDVTSPKKVFVKGKISKIHVDDKGKEEYFANSGDFGNASFYIVDDEESTQEFLVYRTLYLGNKKWTKADNNPDVKVGDEVIIYGYVVNYKGNTPETDKDAGSFLYDLNGTCRGGDEGGEGGEAKGTGTLEDPYNPAGAAAIASKLSYTDKDNYEKTDPVYVKGKISKVSTTFADSGTYGNASFTIVDETDATGSFEVFQTYYLGNRQWKTGDTDIKEGDVVIVYGPLMNFKGNTPETVGKGASYIYSLNGSTEGGDTPGPGPEGDIKVVTNAEFLAAAVSPTQWYELTGTVSNIVMDKTDPTKVSPYGNFDLTDEAGTKVYVYGLTATKQDKNDQSFESLGIKEGDKITIITLRAEFKGEPQAGGTPPAYIKPAGGGGETGDHDGLTPETAFTASEANAWIMANLEDKASTETKYYVKGKIQRFYQRDNVDQNFTNNSYKQASFFITDDGQEAADKEFEAYQIDYLNDATFDPEKDTDVKVGDDVVIYGSLKRWGTTAETTDKGSAYLYSLNAGGQGGGGDEPEVLGIMDSNVAFAGVTNAYTDNVINVTYGGTTYEKVANLKMGKSSAYGDGTVTIPAGAKVLTFFSVGWKGAAASVKLTIGSTEKTVDVVANDGASGNAPLNLTVTDADRYTITLDAPLAAETVAKVETYAGTNNGYRAFIFGFHATKDGEGGGGEPEPEPEPEPETPQPEHEGTLADPFTVNDAFIASADEELTGKEYYVSAVVGKDVTIKNGVASFELVDGTTSSALSVVKAKSFGGAAFDGTEPLDWLDEVVLKGTVTTLAGSLPALTAGELVKWNGKDGFKEPDPDFTTVAELTALASDTATQYTGTLENAVVSFVASDSKTAIVKDATGSIMFYKSSHGLKQGQTFSGKTTVTLTTYKGTIEVTDFDTAFVGDGAVVEPQAVTLAELTAEGGFAKWQNAYVVAENLEVTAISSKNLSVKNGGKTYIVYNNGNTSVAVGDVIKATGTVGQFNNVPQIKAWAATDIAIKQTDFTTVAGLTALASDTAAEKFGKLTGAVVSFVASDNKTAIVKDASGSIMFYKSAHGLKQGQTFTGAVNVTVTTFKGTIEVTAWDATFTGDGAAVDPQAVTLAELTAEGGFAKWQNSYVVVDNLEVTGINSKNVTVKNGDNTYIVYNNGNATVKVGDVIKATGTVTIYNSVPQIKTWTAADVVVSSGTDPGTGGGTDPGTGTGGGTGTSTPIEFVFSSTSPEAQSGVSVAFAKGEGATNPAWNASASELRLYVKNTVTITSEAKMAKIEYYWHKQGSKTWNTVSMTSTEGTYTDCEASTSASDSKKATWEGSSKSVVLTMGDTSSAQRVLEKVVVTLE